MTSIKWNCLAVVLLGLLICHHSNAATINGKVIEINDGDEFTIFNLNRPVKIRLIGMDAPEKDQAFGAAAKQHLFDLIYDKFVVVEYSGIGRDSSLLGRVLLNNIDISAQMIRDGAAWFDPNRTTLTPEEREVYSLSEEAARNEKRGLWQASDPVAPWEFVRAQQQRLNPPSSVPKVANQAPKRNRPTPELTSESLLRTGSTTAEPLSLPGDMSWADGSLNREWHLFQPEGENFSAVIPTGGTQMVKSLPIGERVASVKYYLVREGEVVYELVWMSGPTLGETDSDALKAALNGFLRGVNESFDGAGARNFHCEPTAQRQISSGGYFGREYDLSECTVPGMVRIYTKSNGTDRQFYGGIVFYRQESEAVAKFLKSFTILARKNETQKSKTR